MIQKLTNKLTNKKESNKGFTLVELIVVIVILAILAAILIPGLLKWIDEAKDKQYQLEARSIYMATEAELAKKYNTDGKLDATITIKHADANNPLADIDKLSGLTVNKVVATVDTTKANGTLTKFETEFTSAANGSQKIKATWSNDAWSIEKISAFSS